jgi:5-methylcytosine-specific restriction protein A
MPVKAPRYCARGHGGYSSANCPACQKEWKLKYEKQRPQARSRGYTNEWERLRRDHLRSHPCCVMCGEREHLHVDHIIAHKGNVALLLNASNLQTLCHACHSRKTAQIDGAFGRPRGVGSA